MVLFVQHTGTEPLSSERKINLDDNSHNNSLLHLCQNVYTEPRRDIKEYATDFSYCALQSRSSEEPWEDGTNREI